MNTLGVSCCKASQSSNGVAHVLFHQGETSGRLITFGRKRVVALSFSFSSPNACGPSGIGQQQERSESRFLLLSFQVFESVDF